MKRITSMFLTMIFVFSLLVLPTDAVYGNHTLEPNSEGVDVSGRLTFQQLVEHYAQTAGISFDEALAFFPSSQTCSVYSTGYRVLSVTVNVTNEYKPTLEFYCQTEEGTSSWGIVTIYSVQLNRRYGNLTKQFGGTIEVWLRNAYTIEYVVNGDFYDNGTTTVTGGTNANIGIDGFASFGYNASNTVSSNHYEYCYQHETKAFQR